MGSVRNPRDDVEIAVLERLASEIEDRRMSDRAVAAQIGVGKSRVNKLLRGETSCTVTDLTRLCDMLGLRASTVVAQAEAALNQQGDSPASPRPLSPSPATGPSATGVAPVLPFPERHPRHGVPEVPQEVLARAAASMRPERERELAETTGWRPDLGEEPQVPPESEED